MKESNLSGTLRRILQDTKAEIDEDRSCQSLKRLRQMVRHALPVRSFYAALAEGRAVIAEVKEKSPSQGPMLPHNVINSIDAYRDSKLVKAVSVLTSRSNFGKNMTVEWMQAIKGRVGKPVLRKDFIFDTYQVYQARAYGADAILLMANILTSEELVQLSDLAFELGMDVLFETHCPEELKELPPSAKIIGINCRTFKGGIGPNNFKLARFLKQWMWTKNDHSVNASRFDYIGQLPSDTIKVAESGVSPETCEEVFAKGFHSILVGTSLLMDKRGVHAALEDFESRLLPRSKMRKATARLEPVPA